MNNISIPGFGSVDPSPTKKATAPAQGSEENKNDGVWVCSECHSENLATDKFCVGCGQPKPKDTDSSTWKCSVCGSVHDITEAFCTECGNKRDVDKEAEQKKPDNHDPVIVSSEKEDAPLEHNTETEEDPVCPVPESQEKIVEPENDTWVCSCGTVNELLFNFCTKCGSAKATAETIQKKVNPSAADMPKPGQKEEVPLKEPPFVNKPEPAKNKDVQRKPAPVDNTKNGQTQASHPNKPKNQQKAERQSSMSALLNQANSNETKKTSESELVNKLLAEQGTTVPEKPQPKLAEKENIVPKTVQPTKKDSATDTKLGAPAEAAKSSEASKNNGNPKANGSSEYVKKPQEKSAERSKEPENVRIAPEIVKPVPLNTTEPVHIIDQENGSEPGTAVEDKETRREHSDSEPLSTPVKAKSGLNVMGKKLLEYAMRPGRIVEVSLTSGLYVYFSNKSIEYVSVPQGRRKSFIIPLGPMTEVDDKYVIIKNPWITDKPCATVNSDHMCSLIDIDNIKDEEVVISYDSIVAITVKRLPQYIIKEAECLSLRE